MKPLVKRHFWNGFIQEKIESVQQKISLVTKDFEQLGRNLAQLHTLHPAVPKQFTACESNTINLADHLLMLTISWLGSCINTQAGPAADQYRNQIQKNFNWTERIGEIVTSESRRLSRWIPMDFSRDCSNCTLCAAPPV